MIESAVSVHPGVIEDGRPVPNLAYRPPEELLKASLRELRAPDGAPERRFERSDLGSLADYVEEEARRNDLPERQVQRVVASVGEIAANAFAHAPDAVHVTSWKDGGDVVFDLEDSGRSMVLSGAVGYTPPLGKDERWSLWLARRVDRFEVGRGRRGTVVRLGVHLPGAITA